MKQVFYPHGRPAGLQLTTTYLGNLVPWSPLLNFFLILAGALLQVLTTSVSRELVPLLVPAPTRRQYWRLTVCAISKMAMARQLFDVFNLVAFPDRKRL